jgi:ABC-type Zn uptake system ZnuABC Zn-binding protein ZnuA
MKKIFKFFLVILFVGCVTGCSNDNNQEQTTDKEKAIIASFEQIGVDHNNIMEK